MPAHRPSAATIRLALVVLTLAAIAIGGLLLRPTATAPQLASVPAGVDPGWWQQVSADLEAREYHAGPLGDGWQAPNRRHGLRTAFRAEGVEVVPRAGEGSHWRWTWSLQRWGRPDRLQVASPQAPEAAGPRVEYPRPGLSEWYHNGPGGLEQGFTIAERLDGAGQLWIEGRVGGDLRGIGDERGVRFVDDGGSTVLVYASLHVEDAGGRELPAQIAWEDGLLGLRIDDRDAIYPVTVDPIVTTPAWTEEGEKSSAAFGYCLAPAGDVNGDGYGDIIVGSPNYSQSGVIVTGKAWVYLGSAAGLAHDPVWEDLGEQDGCAFGHSVACAGDVNGDGYDDIIVGAPHYVDDAIYTDGRAYVYYGGPDGPSVDRDWYDDAGSHETSFYFGYSVSTAGDVNGDGYDDALIGDPWTPGGGGQGRLSVFLGGASGLAHTCWYANGVGTSHLGHSVSTAGDIDGDGYDDIVAGAPYYQSAGNFQEGAIQVYRGGATGLSGTPQVIQSDVDYLRMGWGVSLAGDVNGDGYADVLVGCPTDDEFCDEESRILLYRGLASGLDPTPAWTYGTHLEEPTLGWDVATAGDVNGDGYADFLLGYRGYGGGRGRIELFYGNFSGPATVVSWWVDGAAAGDYLGAVATAGDIDGDGFSDVLGGAPSHDSATRTNCGLVSCWRGGPEGLKRVAGWASESNQAGALFGTAVAPAGDVSGDGFDDLLVGAPYYDNGQSNEGVVFLYLGSNQGPAALPVWWAESDQAEALFGWSVASAGDVNGDGLNDLIVGAPKYDRDATSEGAAFVWHSSLSGVPYGKPSNATWQYHAGQLATDLGVSVASAGDVDGDGYADVIVGAPNYDNGTADEGIVYAFHGSPGGLSAGPDWSRDTGRSDSEFGYSVASAGDVNGDGYCDVIVGAPHYDHPSDQEGMAFVYVGSADGLQLDAPWWYAQSDQVGAQLGLKVATAGDVNGDGFSDIVVGAPYYDGSYPDEGLVLVWHGSTTRPVSGTLANADWSVGYEAATANCGWSVASAGDVNADGYSDLVIGMPGVNYSGLTDSGMAEVFHGSAGGLGGPFTDWFDGGPVASALYGAAVASAGDLNGDGFSDVVIGVPGYTGGQAGEGAVGVYWGGNHRGMGRTPRMWQADLVTRLAPLGSSSSPTSLGLGARGRSPAGRDLVRLECEVKPFGWPYDGNGTVHGGWSDTGAPSGAIGSATSLAVVIDGQTPASRVHWRLRLVTANHFFPHSPWLTLSCNGTNEWDARLAPDPTGVDDTPRALAARLSCAPNPCNPTTTLRWLTAQAGVVRLRLFDSRGRLVRTLVDEPREPGPQQIRWDGCDDDGVPLASGVYLARLEQAGTVERIKVSLVK